MEEMKKGQENSANKSGESSRGSSVWETKSSNGYESDTEVIQPKAVSIAGSASVSCFPVVMPNPMNCFPEMQFRRVKKQPVKKGKKTTQVWSKWGLLLDGLLPVW